MGQYPKTIFRRKIQDQLEYWEHGLAHEEEALLAIYELVVHRLNGLGCPVWGSPAEPKRPKRKKATSRGSEIAKMPGFDQFGDIPDPRQKK